MKIPEIITIGSMDYVVTLEDKLYMDMADGSSMRAFGLCDMSNHKIILDPTMQDSQGLEQTLFHEVAHAIMHEQGIHMCEMGVSYDDEEKIIDAIGRGIHGILRFNTDLLDTEECEVSQNK